LDDAKPVGRIYKPVPNIGKFLHSLRNLRLFGELSNAATGCVAGDGVSAILALHVNA
jgi:hypothetical protein